MTTQQTVDEETFVRLTKEIGRRTRPTSAYADGYRMGLHRGHYGSRKIINGVLPHSKCMTRTDRWGIGYQHGFAGQEPSPPRGTPKRDGLTKSENITLRITPKQKTEFDRRGGNKWLLAELDGESK